MKNKNTIITAVVILVLSGLAYLQFRTWHNFNWTSFWNISKDTDLVSLASAIGFIFVTFFTRAMRWSIFCSKLKPTTTNELINPTIVGFTALSLLGRAGEMVRPYLIARKTNTAFSSQMAIWTVERIFDMGAIAIIVALNLAFAPSLRTLPYFDKFQKGGFIFFAGLIVATVFVFILWRIGDAAATFLEPIIDWILKDLAKSIFERIFGWFSKNSTKTVSDQIRKFSESLHTIKNTSAFLKISALSLITWLMVSLCFLEVMRAYPATRNFTFPYISILLLFVILGSAIQLPAVGGGSQLAAIILLVNVFQLPEELAVSCGLMIWLVSNMSLVPFGLLLARVEHVSLRKLSLESASQE